MRIENRRFQTPERVHRFATVLVLCLLSPVWAIKPGQWVHQTQADYGSAELKDVIVNNLGDVRLARQAEQIAKVEGDDSIVYDLQRLGDGRTFAAVGPTGKVVEITEKATATVAEYGGSQVFALAVGKDSGLWVAVSGTPSKLELRGGADMGVRRTIELPGVRYVWGLAVEGDRLWLATGTEGKLITIDTTQADAKTVVALDTPHTNLLCLGIDGKGRVYVGSDGDGLVYRVTPKDGGGYESFVLYDAGEPEIGAILVMEDGTIYVGTADAEQAKPGRLGGAQAEQVGRVERPAAGGAREKIPNVPPKPEPKQDQPKKEEPKSPVARPQPRVPEAAPTAPGPASAAGAPTAEQYDQLRAAVRQRLEQYQQSGRIAFQAAPGEPGPAPVQVPMPVTRRANVPPPPGGAGPGKRGNAVYRITPDGFVREVFRESTMILRLLPAQPGLYVATGNEGELYRIDPDAEEVILLAKMEPRQLPALWRGRDGSLLVGTANPGRVLRLADHYSPTGTLRSGVLDASQVSLWGKLTIAADAPKGTSVDVQTRSGNVGKADDGAWWSSWSAPQPLKLDAGRSGYLDVLSPPARYLQYRLTLHSDGSATPTIVSIALRYLTPNMRPKVASIKAEYPPKAPAPDGSPQPLNGLKIDWQAADPNNDRLAYRLEARPADAAESDPFVTIVKDLAANTYEWDTRTIADGRYILRITASDSPDNVADQALEASRRSDPVTIDNTPPDIANFQVRAAGGGAVEVSADVTDGLTPIAEVRYRVSGDEHWKAVLPVDLIYDSTREQVLVKIPGLSPGTVSVTLRATDVHGNSRYASKSVKVE